MEVGGAPIRDRFVPRMVCSIVEGSLDPLVSSGFFRAGH
jgi:hypothetical protein